MLCLYYLHLALRSCVFTFLCCAGSSLVWLSRHSSGRTFAFPHGYEEREFVRVGTILFRVLLWWMLKIMNLRSESWILKISILKIFWILYLKIRILRSVFWSPDSAFRILNMTILEFDFLECTILKSWIRNSEFWILTILILISKKLDSEFWAEILHHYSAWRLIS